MLARELEDNVLTALCYSKAAASIAQRVTHEIFGHRVYRRIAEAAIDYIQRYHQPPGFHLRDLLVDRLEKGQEGRFMSDVIVYMEEHQAGLNVSFVMDKLDHFIAIATFDKAIIEASDLSARGEIEKAREAIYSARPRNVKSNGIWLADTQQSLRFLDQREEDYFSTGIQPLDDTGIRPYRKEMLLFLGPMGIGKTWFLIECGKQGILHHKKVLHISLEMGEEWISQRYVQSILAVTADQSEAVQLRHFITDDDGVFTGWEEKTITPDVVNEDSRVQIAERLRFLERRPPFRIEAFASGSLTVNQLDMRFDALENEFGFKPDLVLLDYPDIMKLQEGDNYRHSLNKTFVDLRGNAHDRNYALVVVTQGNRGSATAKNVRANMVQEDFSKVQTADKIITYSQTEMELLSGTARLYAEKGRTRRDKFTVMITQNYAIGQFCIDAKRWGARDMRKLEMHAD